jgi:hypothetical protein
MSAILILLMAAGCTGETAASPSGAGTAIADTPTPPTSLKEVRQGKAFIRGCWFASYSEEQVKAISAAAAAAAASESAATGAVDARLLDVTQLVADGSTDEAGIKAAADALAAAERAAADVAFANLVSLVGLMGPDQLAAGGGQAGASAIASALSHDSWLGENNPFTHIPPEASEGTSTAGLVSAKLTVARSYLGLQAAVSGESAALSVLDLSAPDWKETANASATRIFDAMQAHRAASVAAYTTWATALPESDRVRIVLADGTKAALLLPTSVSGPDPAMAAGGGMQGDAQGAGMQGGGMQGGGMQGGQGGGMQGGQGGQGGGMQGGGMQGGGMQGGQGGGMQGGGMQGGGMQGGGMQGGPTQGGGQGGG